MSDIFDDLIGGGADEGPLGSAPAVAGACVLVVGEKAPSGQSMHVEEMVFLKTVHIPQVVFESIDPDTGEAEFGNELEFRTAMDSLTAVSVETALAWCGERVGAVFDAHREEVEAANAGEAIRAPGAAASPVIWKKPPHSTGRNRGQRI